MDTRQAIADEIPRLRRYARALLRDATAADDLVQDTVERALGRIHLWKPGTNLRAWLFTILHNLHRNALRRRARAGRETALDDASELVAETSRPDEGLRIRDLERALEALSDEQRAAVLLVGLEEMSYREASEILGIPAGTLMSRLARGRQRLKRLMDGSETSEREIGLRRVK